MAMDLDAALGKFTLQLQANGRSPHTVRQYRRHVAALGRWLVACGRPRALSGITHETLAEFLVAPEARCRPDGRPKREIAVNALRTSIRCFFGYLAAAGLIPVDPARLVRRAVCAPPPPRGMSEADQTRLLAVLDQAVTPEDRRDRVLFRMMLGTGIRLGSALALERCDLDLEEGTLRIRHAKGGREQDVVIPEGLREVLAGYLAQGEGGGPLFPGPGGRPICARHAQRRLAGWLRRAGVTRRVSAHALRHSFAVAVYSSTKDLVRLQARLGHRSILSTSVYLAAVHLRVS